MDYLLSRHECMGDYSASNNKAKKKVYFTCLRNKISYSIHIPRPTYRAVDTNVFNKPKAYNELKYMIHNTELRMEFYLNILVGGV